MKRITLTLTAALLLAAAPAAWALVPSSFFVMTGEVTGVACSESIEVAGAKTLQCKLDVLPSDSRTVTTLVCIEPKVGMACSALSVGDAVLLVGQPTTEPPTVRHLGLWLDGSVR